jgi:hypothetical protein
MNLAERQSEPCRDMNLLIRQDLVNVARRGHVDYDIILRLIASISRVPDADTSDAYELASGSLF